MWTIDQYCSLEGEKAYSLGLMTKHMADIMYSHFKDSGKLYRLDLKPIENIKEQDNSCFPFLPRKKVDVYNPYKLVIPKFMQDHKLYNMLFKRKEDYPLSEFIDINDLIFEEIIENHFKKHYCCLDKNILRYIGFTTITKAEEIAIENGFDKEKIYELDQSFITTEINRLVPNLSHNDNLRTLSLELARQKTQVNILQTKMCPYAVNLLERRCRVLAVIKKNEIEGLGLSQKQIAKMTQVSEAFVSKIYTLYRCNNELTEDDLWWSDLGRKPNNFSKISEEIYNELCELLHTKGPMEVGIPSYSWTAKAIIHFLKRHNINVTISYVYKFCRKLHLTSKFATRKNPKQNDEQVLVFTTEGFKSICEIAKKEKREIIFVDQCHVEVHHRFLGYSLANTPTICSYDASLAHSSLSICSFIGINGYFRAFPIKGSFKTEDLIDFLEKIKKENKGKKFIFVMDNSPVHTSNESLIWYMQHESFCKVYYLPPYAPKLNVVEFYNNIFKMELKEVGLMTNAEMIERAISIIDKYNSNSTETKNKILSLFLKEECSYINTIYAQVNGVSKQHPQSAA